MKSYFENRMQLLGATKENSTLELFDEEAEFPAPKLKKVPVFSEDKDGNIDILFYTIEGRFITYYNENKTPKPKHYIQKRWKEPKGDRKYHLPPKQGTFPWFPPALVQKYKQQETIPTLFLTEGAFKAFKASTCGMDIIGLTSITHYARDGKLHEDIRKLIEVCQVEHVVVLWDGDCLDISEKALLIRDQLSKRPFGFFNAAKKIAQLIRELVFEKTREAPRVHFMHVKSDSWEAKPKGLDDLLLLAEQEEKLPSVIKDAHNLEEAGFFFYKNEITNHTRRLFQYFRLHDKWAFYQMHQDTIEDTEFFFFNDLFQYDNAKEQLELISPGWAKSIWWVGDEYFEDCVVPGTHGDRRQLLKLTQNTLQRAYRIKDLSQYVKFFHGFCNVPDHFNYQSIIEREGRSFKNRYFPFQHIPKEGSFKTIIRFIQHIFGKDKVLHPKTNEEINTWELGLDYVQLLLMNPKQMLPVICLYSSENNTGKSTFGKLLAAIFGDNVVKIGNADMQSDFNEPYADKLIAFCDETLLERKKDAERIKALSTSSQVLVNPKGQKQYMCEFFCKFLFFSNNKRMIYVNKHDERFWIIKVPKVSDDNPNILEEMKAEIPAFIHYLKNRTLRTKKEGRMHFHSGLIRTKAFEEAVEVNEPSIATDLRENLKEWFIQMPHTEQIMMPMKNILEEFISGTHSKKYIQEVLTDYLGVDLLRDANGKAIFKRGSYTKLEYNPYENRFESKKIRWRGRPYVFDKANFQKEEIRYEDDSDFWGS